jgi:hypothetical protein
MSFTTREPGDHHSSADTANLLKIDKCLPYPYLQTLAYHLSRWSWHSVGSKCRSDRWHGRAESGPTGGLSHYLVSIYGRRMGSEAFIVVDIAAWLGSMEINTLDEPPP